jgi:hypothetical protein
MKNLAISTAAFCLWDIGPKRKLDICKNFGFEHIVIAFSTLKMLKQFSRSDDLCRHLANFKSVTIHSPWRGVRYKDNKVTHDIVKYLNEIMHRVHIRSVIFHYDCIDDFKWLHACDFKYYIKNPCHHSLEAFSSSLKQHGFESVLDINRATRFNDYVDQYLEEHSDNVKAIHVSGYVDDLGRTPIGESGQEHLLEKVKELDAPLIIEGLFSPGDFQGIRDEIQTIKEIVFNN